MSIGALIEKFRAVALDRIEAMNLAMITLEHAPDDAQSREEILREIHTLKGEAKMMGFADVNLVAHQTEHMLILADSHGWKIPRQASDLIFEGFDMIRTLITKQAGANDTPVDLSRYVDQVQATLSLIETSSHVLDEGSDAYTPPPPRGTHDPSPSTAPTTASEERADARDDHEQQDTHSATPSSSLEISSTIQEKVTAEEDLLATIDRNVPGSTGTRIVASIEESAQGGTSRPAGNLSSMLRLQSDNSIRVSLNKLERLSDIASEVHLMGRRVAYDLERLTDVRDQLHDWMRLTQATLPKSHVASLREISHRLDALAMTLTEETHLVNLRSDLLDEQVRGLRHIPLAQVFSHYPRAVRDLAKAQGKRIKLALDLGNIEVDRSILSALSDPLLHLVRNAVDHGLEPTHERSALGKPEEGNLRLEAELIGDSLRVTLEDDGRGLDPEHLKRRAVERGVISSALARELDDQRAMALIFEPGFSTRQEITDVSGRGLGMDIVLRQITMLGGVVEFDSEVHQGTTFTIIIPLSSAVVEVLLIALDTTQFAIHAKDIERIATCKKSDLVMIQDTPYYREQDGTLLPVCSWHTLLLDDASKSDDLGKLGRQDELTLLVLEKGTTRIAAHIDRVIGEREALNRPLGEFLRGIRLCRGVALTGAGEVIPLLNVVELLNRSMALHKQQQSLTQRQSGASSEEHATSRQSWSTMEFSSIPVTRTILVAEDSDVTRTLITGILRNLGYRVLEAADGEIAWEMLHSYRVDLLMTDMQMPNLDGLGLIKRVREDRDMVDLPVIVLSTLGATRDKERAMHLGADAYLVKLDFREKDLVGLIGRYLS